MPATINLSTIAGFIERGDRYDMKTMEITGTSLGRETVTVASVADLRTAVQAFGARMRAEIPEASFLVSISIRKGSRKPNGYDKSYLNNGFGQEDFLRVLDKRTTPAAVPSDASAATASTAA